MMRARSIYVMVLLVATLVACYINLPTVLYNLTQIGDLSSNDKSSSQRDVDLHGVTDFLLSNRNLFVMSLNSSEFAERFIHALTPLIIAEPGEPLARPQHPEFSTNCSASRYKRFLSGNVLHRPRVIVDFVPFGFDLDKLEIRLLENYNNVAAFVIFENELTQTAVPKPLIFDTVKNTPRFYRFKDKIIHIIGTADDILQCVGGSWAGWTPEDWSLEMAMRKCMVSLFMSLPVNHPHFKLQQHIVAALGNDVYRNGRIIIPRLKPLKKYSRNHDRLVQSAPLAIQGDGDEIISGHVLHHLKHCELNSHDFPLYAPCVSYKHNVNFVFAEDELHLNISPDEPDELLHHLIAAGPEIDLLYKFIVFNDTFRHEHIRPHFHTGLVSAVHLSSIHEPTEIWLKAIATHHGMENSDIYLHFPRGIVDHILKGNISAPWLHSVFGLNNLCNINTSAQRVDYFSNNTRANLRDSLPIVLIENARRYPFIIPPCGITKP